MNSVSKDNNLAGFLSHRTSLF